MDLIAIADKTIPADNGKKVLNNEAGITDDIIAAVLAAFTDSRGQLDKFAPHLKAATLRQTLYNVWRFWKSNIKYQVDPKGQQLIKQPQALWALKQGDCKSLSVAVMSTLTSMGIKCAFRFTSYNSNVEFPTHVYVVVKDKGEVIPVDCVWKRFGEEKKPFARNWDYNSNSMPTKIFTISGLPEGIGRPMNFLQSVKQLATDAAKDNPFFKRHNTAWTNEGTDKPMPVKKARQHVKNCKCKMPVRGKLVLPDGPIDQEQMLLLLKKQGLEIEQQNHIINGGIGATGNSIDRAYEIQITGLHNAAAPFMGWPRKKLVGMKIPKLLNDRDHAICGVGNGNMVVTDGNKEYIAFDDMQANEAAAHIEGFFGSIWSGIKSVGKAIGKGAKAVSKIVTAPVKLVAAGVKAVGKFAGKLLTAGARNSIMHDLPGIAPFFLYTFINDPKILAKLPGIVKTKRDKALGYVRLLTGKLQINKATFDQTVRNGIMLKFADTPENVIASWIKTSNYSISGIDVKAVINTAKGVLNIVPNLLRKLMGDMGENLGTDAEQYAPVIEDWGGISQAAANDLSSNIQQTSPQPYTTDQLYNQVQTGQYQQQQYQQAYQQPIPQYDNTGQYDYSGGGSTSDDYGKTGGGGDYPDTGSNLARPKTLDEVVIQPQQAGGGNSGLMLAGLGFLTLMAISGKKGKRA